MQFCNWLYLEILFFFLLFIFHIPKYEQLTVQCGVKVGSVCLEFLGGGPVFHKIADKVWFFSIFYEGSGFFNGSGVQFL